MRVLHPRWRKAVLALFETNGDRTMALRLAGYKSPRPESLREMASRIFADNSARLAIWKECVARFDGAELELIEFVRKIMHDANEKAADRLRAATMLWDRSNPVVNKHKIEVTHTLSVEEIEVMHYRELKKLGAPPEAFLAHFGHDGLARVEAMIAAEAAKVAGIESDATFDDVEYEEIEPAPEFDGEFDEELLADD